MKSFLIAIGALVVGALIGHAIWGGSSTPGRDPVQVIVTQLRTHAVIEHERQLAVWYRACPQVFGKTPEIFVAWPAKLTYQLELQDVAVQREGTTIRVRTGDIRASDPSVPSDFVDSLSTTSIFTFANEQELVNREVQKATPVARYLTTYFLARDPSLQGDFEDELRRLVEHLATALGVPYDRVDVEIPKPEVSWPRLPRIELCAGTYATVNGLPFAKFLNDATVPIGFRPSGPGKPGAAPASEAPKGTASFIGAPPSR